MLKTAHWFLLLEHVLQLLYKVIILLMLERYSQKINKKFTSLNNDSLTHISLKQSSLDP